MPHTHTFQRFGIDHEVLVVGIAASCQPAFQKLSQEARVMWRFTFESNSFNTPGGLQKGQNRFVHTPVLAAGSNTYTQSRPFK